MQHMWLAFAVCILALTIFLIGSFVWLRGAKSSINISFAVFSSATSFWMLANFVGANYKDSILAAYATRLDFISGCGLTFAAWYFSEALLSTADTKRMHTIWYGRRTVFVAVTLSALAAVSTIIPSVLNVVKPVDHELIVTYGPGYLFYTVCLAIILSGVIVNLFLSRRLARGRLRHQIGVMLAALLLSTLMIGFVNLALPQLSHSANINLVGGNLSYIGLAFFVGATFYSIIKHRLFDLRLVLARSAAYLLLVSVLTIGYGLLTVLISNTLVKDYELTGRGSFVPVISIVFLAFTVNPLAKYFNRLTSRLFYKDSYEPQQFLGELNEVIINNIDLEVLLNNVSNVMERYLKAFYVVFDLRRTDHSRQRVIGSVNDLNPAKLHGLHNALTAYKGTLIVTDELSQDHEALHKLLDGHSIGVSSVLSTLHGQKLGYLFVGHKKDGSAYTQQDIEMISIASGELVIAIQNALSFEEIEKFNITLQQRVEEATKRLRQTNAKLRTLDQTKDDFISMASHQLRTPLTSVKGYVSMVLDGDAGKISPLQRKLLNQSFISAQRMVYLISDLLNVSRLKTGKFVIEPTLCNLASVIADEVSQLVETAKGRNLKLLYERPEHFPTYMLDETKLRQVIMNFMDNAIYYTPSGGAIEVNLVENPDSIEFTVVDNGMGVPRAEQHHLFTKFYRANNAKRARPDGTGLGLFMAKKVIIAQGGATIFKSTEGKGSTFGFTFAKSRLTEAPKQR